MSNIYDIYKNMIWKMFNFYCFYLLKLIYIKTKKCWPRRSDYIC